MSVLNHNNQHELKIPNPRSSQAKHQHKNLPSFLPLTNN